MKFTRYEEARILGARALQLSMGAPFLLKLSDKDLETLKFSPIEIAKKEFAEGLVPISVRRTMPGAEKAQASE